MGVQNLAATQVQSQRALLDFRLVKSGTHWRFTHCGQNLSTGVFSIKIKKDEVESLEVYTLNGLLVNNIDIIKGNKVSPISASNCASGRYMVMIVGKSVAIYSKMLIIE